jgi:hypothetical protein
MKQSASPVRMKCPGPATRPPVPPIGASTTTPRPLHPPARPRSSPWWRLRGNPRPRPGSPRLGRARPRRPDLQSCEDLPRHPRGHRPCPRIARPERARQRPPPRFRSRFRAQPSDHLGAPSHTAARTQLASCGSSRRSWKTVGVCSARIQSVPIPKGRSVLRSDCGD